MNLVFIGASTFGLRCLETCLHLPEVSVTGIVTAPRVFQISYRPTGVTNVLHADVAGMAQSHALPVRTLERTMNEPGLFAAVAEWKPDAFLVAGWYHMIPKRWRELAPAYGLHASLLPDYSGGAPLVWAMINGEEKTGITLFQMDDGVDSGPIVGQREEPIFSTDTIATLYARIEERGLELLKEYLPLLASGHLVLQKQDDTKRRMMRQRAPEDGLINWNNDAMSLDRFIRAQTRPYPGAFTTLEGKPLHIWQAQPVLMPKATAMVGQVCRTEYGDYHVVCGNNAIALNEISYEQRNYIKEQLAEIFGGGADIGRIAELLEELKLLLAQQQAQVQARWNRSLPFGDYIVDRWQKARELGFGEGSSIYDSALVLGDVKVGYNTWIGPFTVLDGSGDLTIGDHCSISAGVQIYTHDTVKWATSGGLIAPERAPVKIGSNCYIGPNAVISKGVSIGDGSVIGANSLVKQNVPNGKRAWGTPARIITST